MKALKKLAYAVCFGLAVSSTLVVAQVGPGVDRVANAGNGGG